MTRTTRWLAATALATAGFTAFTAGGVSAMTSIPMQTSMRKSTRTPTPYVDVFQKAWSNTGHNLAVNLTGQNNYADQDADSDADGGDAELGHALFAIGGDGGTAGTANGNSWANGAINGNSIRPVGRRQSTLRASMSARPTRTRRATRRSADSGGPLSIRRSRSGRRLRRRPGRRRRVVVAQEASANSGGNVAVNATGQSNSAYQDADSDADGGDASAAGP